VSDAAARRRVRHRPPLALSLAAALAAAAVALPLIYLAIRAFSGGADAWDVLARERMLELVVRTIALVAVVTAGAVAVGVPLAWLVTRTDLPGRRVWGLAASLPLVFPSYVAALALLAAFGPRGMLQQGLEGLFGVERVPAIYGFPGAFAALVLATYPYVYLLAAAALRELDPALEEVARGLGRSAARVFLTVTLPVVRPSIAAGALLVALYALSDFGAVSLMQYDSLTRAIFVQYRSLFDRTPAAVLSLALVALTAAVVMLEARARGRSHARRTPGTPRPAARFALGRWRWPAFAFCLAVVGVALAVPLGVLSYWLTRAVSLEGAGVALDAAVNSIVVSAIAAAVAVAAAFPVAFLSTRYPSGWTSVLERLSYSSNALPGIVIALALVFFAANYAQPVYQTLALLVAAYVVRFFPQAVAASRAALARVNPRLEDAARGLGRGPRAAFAAVTAPLAAPGLAAGAALVFLSTMKELPATLLLRPIGFETLATEVWTATSLGLYSEAAAPALLLVVAAAPFVYTLSARRAADLGAPG
jgi:iron(III) transport system permease protein